jgi:SPP1 family predicted phage head-tail adaptor
MRSGKLRHRISIEALVSVVNTTTGATEEQWVAFISGVPADVVPLSGREFVAAAAKQSEIAARITIRYTPGVLPTMRVNHDDTIYGIKAVLPDPTLRRHLTLMCDT